MMAGIAPRSSSEYGFIPGRLRAMVLAGVVLLHAALMLLFYMGALTSGVRPDRSIREGRSFSLFSLRRSAAIDEPTGGKADDLLASAPSVSHDGDAKASVSEPGRSLDGAAENHALGDALAAVLSDDPFAAVGRARYQSILRRHIAHYRQSPANGGGRLRFGTAIIRVNIDRDGRIVDARVLQTQGASLDEAALAALWRAEPLPPIPTGLPAPLGVDVVIDFVNG